MHNYTPRPRNERLKLIKTLIHERPISSQDELLTLLDDRGVLVTQATLSRDLKLLRVVKTTTTEGLYCYALPDEEELKEDHSELVKDFHRGFLGMDANGSLVVIKTLAGHANSVGLALDNLDFLSILGCVAGDDTLLVILKEGFEFQDFKEELLVKMPEEEV